MERWNTVLFQRSIIQTFHSNEFNLKYFESYKIIFIGTRFHLKQNPNELPMSESSTPYIFQYSYFFGVEQSSLLNANIYFDQEQWLLSKINELIAKTPEIPDRIIKRILEKTKIC